MSTPTSAPVAPPACAVCGAPPPTVPPPPSWSVGIAGGQRSWTCDRCARDHIRSIEGKLDQTWW